MAALRLPTSTLITLRFSEDSNLQGLIDDGTIFDAVRILDPNGDEVNLDDGSPRITYNNTDLKLAIDLTKGNVGLGGFSLLTINGNYELQLAASMILESPLGTELLDTDSANDGIVRFAFERVYGDFDGDGTVTLADRALLLTHIGFEAGDAKYNADYDMNADGRINFIDYIILRSRLRRR